MSRVMSRTENTLRIGCTQVDVPCGAEASSSLPNVVSLVAVCRLRRLWNLGQTTKEPGSQHKQGTSGLCTDLKMSFVSAISTLALKPRVTASIRSK